MDEELDILNYGCVVLPNNIGSNANELLEIYGEEVPYLPIQRLDGTFIKWNENFIQKCLIGMATDDISSMSELEKKAWNYFVLHEDSNNTLYSTESESLDDYFMELYNCVQPETYIQNAEVLENVSPCTI